MKGLSKEELEPFVALLLGAGFFGRLGKPLNLGWRRLGRLERGGFQATLDGKKVSVVEVYRVLLRVADAQGAGSMREKQRLLTGLTSRMTSLEREVLTRILLGEMRIGASEGILLESISKVSGNPTNLVRRAYMFTGDLSVVAKKAFFEGPQSLQELGPSLFTPIKPMLTQTAYSPEEALERLGGRAAFEFKYDGARIQVHKSGSKVQVYSRSLKDITGRVPDVVQLVKRVPGESLILDGEAVAFGPNNRPLPFQEAMRRLGRVKRVSEKSVEIPLKPFFFDILYLDGRSLVDQPYDERWKMLEETIPPELLTRRVVSDNPREVEALLAQSIRKGHEGLVAKRLSSPYEPGSRGGHWLKVKASETLDLVVLAADWGSGRRRGWLSNYHLGARSPRGFLPVGKTFKGLTDEEFRWMTDYLLGLKIEESRGTVFVRPELVVEVAFDEVQRSPNYESGFALRFARIKGIRVDKKASEANTIQDVSRVYENQFRFKDRLEW